MYIHQSTSDQVSYKHLLLQGSAFMAVAYFAGSLRCLKYYSNESLSMAGLSTAATLLTKIKTKTTDQYDFKSLMITVAAIATSILGASFALKTFTNIRTLPFPIAIRIIGIQFSVATILSVASKMFRFKIPQTIKEIEATPSTKLLACHTYFKGNQGTWLALHQDIRSRFIRAFYENNLPIVCQENNGDFDFGCLPWPKTPEDVQKLSAEQSSWCYEIFNCSERFKNLPILVQHAFNDRFVVLYGRFFDYTPMSLEVLTSIQDNPVEKDIMSRLQTQFKDKNASKFDALTQEVQQQLNNRFEHFKYAKLPTHTERLTTFTPESITAENTDGRAWHAIFTTNLDDLWNPLPKEKKEAFNKKFTDLGLHPLNRHIPQNVGEVEAILSSEILDYHAYFKENQGAWLALHKDIRSRFIQAFYENNLPVVCKENNGDFNFGSLTWPKTPEDVQKLSLEQSSWYYEIFNCSERFKNLPILVQHAFNNQFARLYKLFFHYTPITSEILTNIEGNPVEKDIMSRLQTQFKDKNAWKFDALTQEVQQQLNNRFEHFQYAKLPTHTERLTVFNPESITAKNTDGRAWHAIFTTNLDNLWNPLPKEKKEAFNKKFASLSGPKVDLLKMDC